MSTLLHRLAGRQRQSRAQAYPVSKTLPILTLQLSSLWLIGRPSLLVPHAPVPLPLSALPAIAPIITSGLIKSKRRPLVRPAQRYQIPIPLYRTTSTRPRTLGRENDGGGSEGAGRRGTRQCGGSKGEAKKRETGMEGSRRTRLEEP